MKPCDCREVHESRRIVLPCVPLLAGLSSGCMRLKKNIWRLCHEC